MSDTDNRRWPGDDGHQRFEAIPGDGEVFQPPDSEETVGEKLEECSS
jgi:hypothetical protein